jgi:hypothetical protein
MKEARRYGKFCVQSAFAPWQKASKFIISDSLLPLDKNRGDCRDFYFRRTPVMIPLVRISDKSSLHSEGYWYKK